MSGAKEKDIKVNIEYETHSAKSKIWVITPLNVTYNYFCIVYYWLLKYFPGGSGSKESACNVGDLGSIPDSGRTLEKVMATHFSILAWRVPWTEEPDRL